MEKEVFYKFSSYQGCVLKVSMSIKSIGVENRFPGRQIIIRQNKKYLCLVKRYAYDERGVNMILIKINMDFVEKTYAMV